MLYFMNDSYMIVFVLAVIIIIIIIIIVVVVPVIVVVDPIMCFVLRFTAGH